MYLSSTLAKLLHIINENRTDLFQILTLEQWNMKSTGYQLEIIGKNNDWTILEDLKYNKKLQKEFMDYLSNKYDQNQEYKIRAYSQVSDNEIIFMIYKLKNDLQRIDFDKSKRIKDVDKIFIKINQEKSLLHIKCNCENDMINIKSYFKEKLKKEISLYQQPIYDKYNPNEFKQVFEEGNRIYDSQFRDFKIDKIVFYDSLLSKSPELSLYTPKQNVWPSVSEIVSMNIINIESLNCIKSININYKKISRRINSYVLDDGSVIFKLIDNGLRVEQKDEISECFKNFFGIPLNQRIIDKLEHGNADNVDLILRLKKKDNLNEVQKDIFKSLNEGGVIEYSKNIKYLCKNKDCRNEIEISNKEKVFICEKCGEEGYIEDIEEVINISDKKIEDIIIDTILKGLSVNIENLQKDKLKINKLELNTIKFNYNDICYQFILTNTILPKKITDKIQKTLMPTILLYYGVDKIKIKDMTPDTIGKLQFGKIYINKDDDNSLKKIYKSTIDNVKKLFHHKIVASATLANDNIRKNIIEDNEKNKQYTYNDLEDDTFAIIKDIFYNSDKWGRENIGKAVPEGVFAMSYIESNGEALERKYAFSYDCKLTAKAKGYDLNKSEQRKAEDYVEKLNNEAAIKAYCSNKNISAHIFIGNKFRNQQIKGMIEHFNSKLGRGYTTKPMFIEIENLLKLHDWYRLNYENIKNNINQFYEEIYKVMMNNTNVISSQELDRAFEEISQYFRNPLNTEKIKKNLIK